MPFFGKSTPRRNLQPGKPGFAQRVLLAQPPAPASSRIGEAVIAIVKGLYSYSFWVLGFLLVAAIGVALLGKVFRPREQILVQNFELPAEIAKQLQISSTSISAIVSDDLNRMSTEGMQFHGIAIGADAKHFGKIPDIIKIPVKTSMSVTIKGISSDDVRRIYDLLRYDQITIDGDLYQGPAGSVIRIRMNRGNIMTAWEVPLDPHQTIQSNLHAAAIQPMTSISPALVGRMYLYEHRFPDAIKTFVNWTNADPLNPQPLYYLAYSYDADHDHSNSMDLAPDDFLADSEALAAWAIDTAHYRNVCSGVYGALQCFWVRHSYNLSKPPHLSFADLAQSTLASIYLDAGKYDQAHASLAKLLRSYPGDLNLRINLGVASEGEGNQTKDPEVAGSKYREAFDSFRLAEFASPDNPLVQRDLAVELYKLRQFDRAVQHDRAAVHLNPGYAPPLLNAVGILWSLSRYTEAADLCRIVTLLRSADMASLEPIQLNQQKGVLRVCAAALVAAGSVPMGLDQLNFEMGSQQAAEAFLRNQFIPWNYSKSTDHGGPIDGLQRQLEASLTTFDNASGPDAK